MNLCGGRLVGSMALPVSNPTRQPFAAFPKYPAGLRVLVVGDDPTCLRILERMLQACQFEVTKCDRAEHALNELRKNKSSYDIVLSDVYMRGMGGFKLLEHIGLEIDLPVVMISADDSEKVVLKAVKLGACDYLIKPVCIETLINIWQHVVRKKKDEWKAILQSRSVEEAQKQEGIENSSLGIDRNRVVWSIEFHQQFVAAVNQLGIDKAVPMEILEMINVPGLTRESVASHLQKYRSHLKMVSEISQHQGGLNGSFMSPQARPGQLMNESSVGSQTPSYVSVDFSPNQLLNGSPLRSTLALTTSKGIIQEEVKSNLKGLKGFGLNYMYNLLINNPLSKVKTEKDQFARDDLMSLILKQVWLPILLVLCIGVLLHLSK